MHPAQTSSDDLTRLRVKCPACQRHPNIRVSVSFSRVMSYLISEYDTDDVALTVQCTNRHCRRLYEVTVSALATVPLD